MKESAIYVAIINITQTESKYFPNVTVIYIVYICTYKPEL